MTQLLSVRKACEVLDISDTTLYKLLNLKDTSKAQIKSFNIGRTRKIDSDEVTRFIEESEKSGVVEIE
jgi:excisionase family DNA binding protein